MSNVKILGTAKIATGVTVYCIVRREVDGYLLDDSDGSFGSGPADPYLSLTEDGTIKGLYEVSESRETWEPGWYTAFFYTQSGGSPAPASDTLDDSFNFCVVGDSLVVNFPYEYAKVVTDVSNGANTFKTDLLSSTSDYCVGSYLKFASGALANQVRRITAYNGTSKFVTVASAFTATPAGDDEFFLVNQ